MGGPGGGGERRVVSDGWVWGKEGGFRWAGGGGKYFFRYFFPSFIGSRSN